MVTFGNEELDCKYCKHLKINGTCLHYAGVPNAQKCGKYSATRDLPKQNDTSLFQEIERRAAQLEDDFAFEPGEIKRAILAAVKEDRLLRYNPRTAIRFVRSLGASGIEVVCSDCGKEMWVDQLYDHSCPNRSCPGKMILSSLL